MTAKQSACPEIELDQRLSAAGAVVREAGRVAADHFARRAAPHAAGRAGPREQRGPRMRGPDRGGSLPAFPEDAFLARARLAQPMRPRVGDRPDRRHALPDRYPVLVRFPGTRRRRGVRARHHLRAGRHRALLGEKGRRRVPKRQADQGKRRGGARARPRVRRLQLPAAGRAAHECNRRSAGGWLRISPAWLRRARARLPAAGRFDGYWESHTNSWDAAARAWCSFAKRAAGRTISLAGTGLSGGKRGARRDAGPGRRWRSS